MANQLPSYSPQDDFPSPPATKALLSDMQGSPSRPTGFTPQSSPSIPHAHHSSAPHPPPQGQEFTFPERANQQPFWVHAKGWVPQSSYTPGIGQINNPRATAAAAPAVLSTDNVVPVPLLQRWPAVVKCPSCGEPKITEIRYRIGTGTHALAALLLFTTGIGVVVPYIAPQCKDVTHSCSGCGTLLATNWFLSGTEGHVF